METHDEGAHFYLKKSTIPGAGLGVFARLPLHQGDCLEVVGVCVKPGSDADHCTAFADRHKFLFGDQLIIPLGFAGMVNHSAAPNLVRHEEAGRLFLKALRDIAADEELFHAYNDAALARMGLKS